MEYQRMWWILLPAVCLDWLLGDPAWLPHPVRWIGGLIRWLEGLCYPSPPGGRREMEWRGLVLVVLVLTISVSLTVGLLRVSYGVAPELGWGVELWFSAQMLAARSLHQESWKVYVQLKKGDLPLARVALSWIVGRDTQNLSPEGVTRGAVETVAENTSDGIIAPLLALGLGGLPLAVAYKAVNTMDSMLGYHSVRYEAFGLAPATLDDWMNWIPARLTGCLMCLAAWILPGYRGRQAWTVFLRDRRAHPSPNAGHPEAACAGALGVELAGDSVYFGVLHHKPTIGDALRPIEPQDIGRSIGLMYAAELLCLIGMGVVFLWLLPDMGEIIMDILER